MNQFRTREVNYARAEVQRAIAAGAPKSDLRKVLREVGNMMQGATSSTKRIVAVGVAGLAVGTMVAFLAHQAHKGMEDRALLTPTVESVNAQGRMDPSFDAGIKRSLEKVHALVTSTNSALKSHPEVVRVFRHEAVVDSLNPAQTQVYERAQSMMEDAKFRLHAIHTALDNQSALSVVDGRSKFFLAESLQQKLETTEALFKTTAEPLLGESAVETPAY